MTRARSSAQLDVHGLDPESFAQRVWRELAAAVSDRSHPFRIVSLGTRGLDDDPQLRCVVLRLADRSKWRLGCYTDRRSPKVTELQRDPRCAWLFYDPAMQLQVRVQALADLHLDDALADEAWARTPLYSRACYMGPLKPSTPLPGDLEPADAVVVEPPADAQNRGRENFALLRARIVSLDCLYLSSAGHRRIRVVGGAQVEETHWLSP